MSFFRNALEYIFFGSVQLHNSHRYSHTGMNKHVHNNIYLLYHAYIYDQNECGFHSSYLNTYNNTHKVFFIQRCNLFQQSASQKKEHKNFLLGLKTHYYN